VSLSKQAWREIIAALQTRQKQYEAVALTNQSLAADAAWERSRLCGRVVGVVKEKLGEVTGEAPKGEPRGHVVQTNEPTGGA